MMGAGHDRWSLWGTYAFLAVTEARLLPTARRVADDLLDAVDRTCSRFRPDSDLSQANRHPGRWVEADPLLVAATRVAVGAAEATGGLVDPCLGRVLSTLGYDVTLAELDRRPPTFPGAGPFVARPRPEAWREIGVEDGAVRVPPGVALDLGATAKAWAADLLATLLGDTLGCPVVVSLGGDLRVHGPEGAPVSWPVQVSEHPDDTRGAPTVLVSGGLATSSTVVRRWRTAAREQHHLIDPRTGRPVREVYRTVTAVGRSSVAANTATTAALVLGAGAPRWLAEQGVSARLVDAHGAVTTVGDWPSDHPSIKEDA